MVLFALSVFIYLFVSLYLAQKLNKVRYISWWIILFLVIGIFSVEFLGIFGLLNVWAMLVLGLFMLFICFALEGFSLKIKSYISNILPLKVDDVIFISVAFVFSFVVALFNEITPISEIDSIAYHLPILTNFISTHNIWEVFHAGYVGPNTFFPANHEALQAFFAILSGKINLGFIVDLLSIFLFYSALRDLSRKYNISKVFHFLIVFATISVPFLFNQLPILQVDLFMFCMFGSSLAFLISSIINKDHTDLAKSFLTLGLMIGGKYNGVPQAIMMLPLFVVGFFVLKKHIRTTIWYPLLTLLSGSFWYFRNWIIAGNPIYPFGINLGFINFEGHKNFIAETFNTSLWHFFGIDGVNNVIKTILNNWDFTNQLGPVSLWIFPFTLIVVLVAIAFILLRKKFDSKNEKFWIIFIFGALLYLFFAELFYYLKSPYTFTLWNQTIRYSSPLFATLPIVLLLSACYSKLAKFATYGFLLLFAIYNLVYKSFIFDKDYVLLLSQKLSIISFGWFLVLMICVLFIILGLWFGARFKKPILRYVALAFVALSLSFYQFHVSDKFVQNTSYDDDFLLEELFIYPEILPHIKVLRKIDDNEKGNIALVGLTTYFLFEKEGYKPIYVNVDGCVDCQYFDYRNEDKSIRAHPDEEKWKEALKELDIKYLMIDKYIHGTAEGMYEEEWAQNSPNIFKPLFLTDRVRLYKVDLQDT